MKQSQLTKNVWLMLVAGTVSMGVASTALACDTKKSATTGQQAVAPGTADQPAAAGMTVHIDPQTGEVVEPPAQEPPQSELQAGDPTTSTSSAGLVAEPSPVPGGGIGINLQGRFQSPLVATQGSDGKVKIEHQAHDAETGGKH